jgi:hypothetical protein
VSVPSRSRAWFIATHTLKAAGVIRGDLVRFDLQPGRMIARVSWPRRRPLPAGVLTSQAQHFAAVSDLQAERHVSRGTP